MNHKKCLGILLFILLLSEGINAQEKLRNILPLKDNKVTYISVVQADSISKDELYERAKRWLTYAGGEIKFDDSNVLVGKGYFTCGAEDVWYKIIIQLKEGRYKYELTDFNRKVLSVANGPSFNRVDPIENTRGIVGKKIYYRVIDGAVNRMIASLEKTMESPRDDNW